MEKDQESPFPREPWQRLLQDRADTPPETTDARIRAVARKAVLPRAARWWLPASLAASLLLAVLIVQWQYGNEERPAVVTESDLATPVAPAPPPAAEPPGLARERATDSAAAARKESVPSELHYEMAPEVFPEEPEAESDLGEISVTGSRVSGPEQDLKAASEMDSKETDPDALPPVPEVAAREEPITAITATPAEATSAGVAHTNAAGMLADKPAAKQRMPEAWYADIEALRKAGRNEEADAELARFEVAYPDWLKQHNLQKP